ncbi:hypothetical protein PNOK_0736700 [Pyrrhoderma noxium]|uniref:Uncharacterized protein n=1 Tax=Pyrrhoderma noxium TaxID=2282107 RepID=A0A286UCI9_9AGAM|nr:hypothetical protein PNOK_0736700 [Pyrrhoderma noxium]
MLRRVGRPVWGACTPSRRTNFVLNTTTISHRRFSVVPPDSSSASRGQEKLKNSREGEKGGEQRPEAAEERVRSISGDESESTKAGTEASSTQVNDGYLSSTVPSSFSTSSFTESEKLNDVKAGRGNEESSSSL